MNNKEMDTFKNVLKTKKQFVNAEGNGKSALVGNGDAFCMAPSIEGMLKKEAETKMNESIEEEKQKWDEKMQEQLAHAKEIDDKMQSMEIVPINSYVLVQPFAKNPFQKSVVTESGLFIPEYGGQFKNPDSGEMDQEENLSVQAVVVEVSPLCKFVKEGDIVFYRRVSGVPIPFFGQGFEVISEQQIQVIVNEKLKERFKNFKNE